jgi:hypothetical protein
VWNVFFGIPIRVIFPGSYYICVSIRCSMENLLYQIPEYMLSVLLSTLTQVFILFGPTLLLAILMQVVSTGCQNLGYRLMGSSNFLNVFGWLGTAVHELGHALFALLFFHKITEMKLFSPGAKKGSLGYVTHTWNSKNPYQVTGNFFIGIGPVIMGSLMLFLVTGLLFFTNIASMFSFDMTAESLIHAGSLKQLIIHIVEGDKKFLFLIFAGPETSWWKIILFVYLLFSIGSSITLSMADIKGALQGFLVFLLILVVFNLVTRWIGNFTTTFFTYISSFFSAFYFLLILSILLNIMFLIILGILVGIKLWVIKKSEE